MERTLTMKRILLFAGIGLFTVGCSARPIAVDTSAAGDPQRAALGGTAGPSGPSGPVGARGPAGPAGATGPVGVVERWTSFRDILFDSDRTSIRSSETSKVSEVVSYMKQNPSLQVGLDGYANPRSTDPNAQTMRNRRVGVVRDALIQAGVRADKIRTGAFGEGRLTCNDSAEACRQSEQRVEVLIRTGN